MTQFGRVAEIKAINTAASQEITISGLRITWSIQKKEKLDENSGTIKIYNLSPSSRGLLEEPKDAEDNGQIYVDLKAGYAGSGADTIFKGFCFATSEFVGSDWVTTLKGVEGKKEYMSFEFEKTYPAGTPIITVLQDMAKKSGAPISLGENAIKGTLPRGRAFSGAVKSTIEDLQGKYGFQFTVQNGNTKVQGGSSEVTAISTTLLNASTGLLGKPAKMGDIIKVKCLVNPAIEGGSAILLESIERPDLKGKYTVKKYSSSGDTWGGEWSMNLELSKDGPGPENFAEYFKEK
ncbi:MAG: hypothetical protein E2O82_03690 [Betaproteobacteria bacterium]|nr:MAG: hypothetical protein E2O82_03690 [Betaproteobacteria bacterium]